MPKYFVGSTVTLYYHAEIEASSEVEANHKFWSLNYDSDEGVVFQEDETYEEIYATKELD